MSGQHRHMVECQREGCWNFCVVAERDPQKWTCPICLDLELEQHVRYQESLSLTRQSTQPHKEPIAS